MEKKTAKGLVAWARDRVGNPYWYGTCCYPATKALLSSKTASYPTHYTAGRKARYLKDIAAQAEVADCVGLIKGYLWHNETTGKRVYQQAGAKDTTATGMYNAARVKGPLATMPEKPGLLVWRSGHIGVYIGNGFIVEARGFAYGIQCNKLLDRDFTNWCECPWIDYAGEGPEDIIEPLARTLKLRTVRLRGDDVKIVQQMLEACGFTPGPMDGIYGPKTTAAVKGFQKGNSLKVDGIVGPITWGVLLKTQP